MQRVADLQRMVALRAHPLSPCSHHASVCCVTRDPHLLVRFGGNLSYGLSFQAFPARQDLGPYLDRLTAEQPQGPTTQGPLKRAGIQDADSIHSQVQMTKMLEVLFFHGFHANNAMQMCPPGSEKNTGGTCQSGFIAKQVPHLLDSYLAREPRANNLWQHSDEGLPYSIDSPFW